MLLQSLDKLCLQIDQFFEEITSESLESYQQKDCYDAFVKKIYDFFIDYLRLVEDFVEKLNSSNILQLEKFQKLMTGKEGTMQQEECDQLDKINKKLSSLYKKC